MPQQNKAKPGHGDDNQERNEVEPMDKYHVRNTSNYDAKVGQLPQDATKTLDREKLKAAFERRQAQGDITRQKVDPLNELERELEDVEVPGERKQSWPKPSRSAEHENSQSIKYNNNAGNTHFPVKGQSDFDAIEEGEVELSDETDRGYRSPRSIRKRKPESPIDRNGLGRHGYSERDHKRHAQENRV